MPKVFGHIAVVAVGKLRAPHWQAAQEEYLKRLRRYGNVRLVEVKDNAGRGAPDAVAVQREAKALLDASSGARARFALSPEGRRMTSEGFAEFLRGETLAGGSIALLVGGPLGLGEEVAAACRAALSLSDMTLPHELARVVLLEQIYRAGTILCGEKYHK